MNQDSSTSDDDGTAESAGKLDATTPLSLPRDSKPAGTRRLLVNPAPATSMRYRILVVDDSHNNAKLFAMMLELMGHEARFVTDGASALDLLASYRPDILFSDIGMDRMDGYELARRVRSEDAHRGIFLVVHSGYSERKDRDRATAAGFDFFLQKPAEPRTLNPLFAEIALRKKHDGG